MARRKANAVEAPQTEREAIMVAADYATLERAIAKADAICDEQIDKAKTLRDTNIDNLKPKLAIRFAELQAYFSANEEALTGGNKRSITLGPVVIGERLSTPKLKLPKGVAAAKMVLLLRALWSNGSFTKRFVKAKYSLDKQAIISALKPPRELEDDEAFSQSEMEDELDRETLSEEGLSITQKDEFFVKLPEEESLPEPVS